MTGTEIVKIKAREVLDSKARPMVEADVLTAAGALGRGASPCGTSVGRHEAFVLRDGDGRYGGLGVRKAVRNVMEVIGPALIGKDSLDQQAVDHCMISLDGTSDKSRLGANAIYSVSIAVARAAAASLGLSLFRYLGGVKACQLPVPLFNMINGGTYGSVSMAFQEFLFIPSGASTYSEALRMGVEVYAALGDVVACRYGRDRLLTAPSAGYGAPSEDPGEVLELLLDAADKAGYGGKCRVGIDCAASHFYDVSTGVYRFRRKDAGRQEIFRILEELAGKYPLFVVEDPVEEDDFEGMAELTQRLGGSVVIGDDLFVASLERLRRGVAVGAANAILLKPNMIGTISEALDTARYAREHGYRIVGSGRAGGGIDDPIPDISVAAGAVMVKFGAPRSGERLGKQNCMLRIEEELGENGVYAGPGLFAEACAGDGDGPGRI
ncbi:MAG: phosphopyruvate hydratase [Deltaproteobacteria bacterium]|nr:phosphopyruvate hydratase [Deltaproteobacteria bacterium]